MSVIRSFRFVLAAAFVLAVMFTISGCSQGAGVGETAPAAEAGAPAAAPSGDTATAPAPAAPKPAATKPAPTPAPAPREPRYATVTTVVPTGTSMTVAFDSALSSESSQVGDAFTAHVVGDVVVDGAVAVPSGSVVHGTVTAAVPTKKIGGQASLTLAFDRVELPDGATAPLVATLVQAGKKQTAKDAGTIAGSTAGGAILGRVLDKKNKDKATAIGAVVGAAVGTAIAAKNEGDPVMIESGANATIATEQPIEIQQQVRIDE